SDLRAALLASAATALAAGGLAWATGMVGAPASIPGGGAMISAALGAYFFSALPAELLLRGVAQNGVARALAARDLPRAPLIGLVAGVALAIIGALISPGGGWRPALIAAVTAIGCGWAYLRTGKVTASAVPHMFVALVLHIFAMSME
ncbi:MAG: CPBP family glutamic-type intramembrane protease, partial [Chloroflexales bacterium]